MEKAEYFVDGRGSRWKIDKIEPPPPMMFECFPYIQLWGGPWEDAEVGRRVPRSRVPG